MEGWGSCGDGVTELIEFGFAARVDDAEARADKATAAGDFGRGGKLERFGTGRVLRTSGFIFAGARGSSGEADAASAESSTCCSASRITASTIFWLMGRPATIFCAASRASWIKPLSVSCTSCWTVLRRDSMTPLRRAAISLRWLMSCSRNEFSPSCEGRVRKQPFRVRRRDPPAPVRRRH